MWSVSWVMCVWSPSKQTQAGWSVPQFPLLHSKVGGLVGWRKLWLLSKIIQVLESQESRIGIQKVLYCGVKCGGSQPISKASQEPHFGGQKQ